MINLRSRFAHLHWRPMPHSNGVEVASDFADYPEDHPTFGLYKKCGLWTMDEAQLLFDWAQLSRGAWLDIGSHTGWTTAHIALAGNAVTGIDPMYNVEEFRDRAKENLKSCGVRIGMSPLTSESWFKSQLPFSLAGLCIDGDHSPGLPLEDARNALANLRETGVIILHDAIGQPVQEAVMYLTKRGMNCKVYLTPHVVAACWRGIDAPPLGFPPEYTPDPRVAAAVRPHLGELAQYV